MGFHTSRHQESDKKVYSVINFDESNFKITRVYKISLISPFLSFFHKHKKSVIPEIKGENTKIKRMKYSLKNILCNKNKRKFALNFHALGLLKVLKMMFKTLQSLAQFKSFQNNESAWLYGVFLICCLVAIWLKAREAAK